MKRNKVFRVLCVAVILLSTACQCAAAAAHIAQVSADRDSTFMLPIRQADHITVRTSNINLTIRRWADSKAQLVVTAEPEDWKGDLIVRMRSNADGILVELKPKPRGKGASWSLPSDWSLIRAILDIPDGHEFVLESRFAKVEVLSDFRTGDITVDNGELTALSIPQLELNVRFSKVHLNSCHQASVIADNTTMVIGAVDILQLDSRFSSIDLTTVNQLTLTSDNDALSIADLGAAMGRKRFGSFRIGKLRKGFSLDGQNADITFGEINASVDTLKIDDQFAQLHIPLDGVPGFSLHFVGRFATVKTGLPSKPVGDQTELNRTDFIINKGTGSGKFPLVSLHCNNCGVDLE